MIVFSNTTPIIALSSINKLDLLPALFNEINLVDTVVEECSVGGKIIVPDLRRHPKKLRILASHLRAIFDRSSITKSSK